MSEILAADVEAAESLARLMTESGQSFKDQAATLSRQLETVAWNGNMAERFRGEWHGSARQRLMDIAGMLDDAALRLADHARAQRQVSDGEGLPAEAALAGVAAAGTLGAVQGRGRRPGGAPVGGPHGAPVGGGSDYDRANDTFFGSTPPPGSVRATYRTRAIDPEDKSIYVYRLFIPDKEVRLPGGGLASLVGIEPGGLGDNRGFSTDPNVTSRVAVAWRPADGTVTYTSYESHDLSGKRYAPMPVTSDAFQITEQRKGLLGFTYQAQNSVNPNTTPAIDGQVLLSSDVVTRGSMERNVGLTIASDDYPAMEAYRYWNNGRVDMLGTAREDRSNGPLALFPPSDDRRIQFFNGRPR
jgi:hypothetical protein